MTLLGAMVTTTEMGEEVFKTADESVYNSITLQQDDGLIIPLAASTTYFFQYDVFYSTNDTADFKFQPNYSGTVTSIYYIMECTAPGAATSVAEQVYTTITTYTVDGTLGATHGYVRMHGTIITNTSGNLKLFWAQGTADTSYTYVLAGSRLRAVKVI